MITILLIIILSYLIGSIPSALIAGRIILKDDLRKYGSGNAGATNVYRVMGWKPALFVMCFDIAKGTIAVLFISQIHLGHPGIDHSILQIVAGLGAVAGHVWTIFAGFRGGKGVGTAFGVFVAMVPFATLLTLIIWLVIVLTVRIVSVGSLAAGMIFPIAVVMQRRFMNSEISIYTVVVSIILGVLIIVNHRSNIKRLIRGQEKRLNFSKRK